MTNLIEWLKTDRKLDAPLLDHMGIRQKDHPALGPVVAFPYLRRGEPYAAKFRTKDKRFASSKGVSRGLYNEDVLRERQDQPVVITEGEIDCLSVMQAGFLRAVSVPDGWTEKGNKTDALVQAEDLLLKSPFVIVAGDADEAGESLPRAIANLLDGHDVRFVTWPDGCKDANDVLVKHGEAALVEALNAAKTMDPEGGFITGFSDLPPLAARRVLRSGIDWVDERVAFEIGAMSVATGTPGVGKSTLVTWLMHHVTANERVRCGMMAFETHPHRTRDHLVRLSTGHPFDRLPRPMVSQALADLDARFRIVHRTFHTSRSHNLGWVEDTVRALAVRDQCKIIVIDPWNELEHMPEPGESLTNYINWALLRIRQLAEKLDVHIVVVAHPKKMDEGNKRPPRGYDIADSAAFYNKPSLGFSVHAEKTDAGSVINQIITWKVRDVQLYGVRRGVADCTFDLDRMTYFHLETNNE